MSLPTGYHCTRENDRCTGECVNSQTYTTLNAFAFGNWPSSMPPVCMYVRDCMDYV